MFDKETGEKIRHYAAKALAFNRIDDLKRFAEWYEYADQFVDRPTWIDDFTDLYTQCQIAINPKKNKVFLGGTCNNSTWRDELIPMLTVDYFNPVVTDWTPECQEVEIREREAADIVLYVITPLMTGMYSIAEAVDDSHIHHGKVIFAVLDVDAGQSFTPHQIKSLEMTGKMIARNGGAFCRSLAEVASLINQ